MDQRKKAKRKFPWAIIVLVLGLLSQIVEDGGGGAFAGILVIVISIVLTAFVIRALTGGGNSAARRGESGAAARSFSRLSAPSRQPSVPIHRDFPEPEAHCVVCDNTGVDHFERDRERRIAQLDEWLKNGLIDKTEYRTLKDRFERDV